MGFTTKTVWEKAMASILDILFFFLGSLTLCRNKSLCCEAEVQGGTRALGCECPETCQQPQEPHWKGIFPIQSCGKNMALGNSLTIISSKTLSQRHQAKLHLQSTEIGR